MRRTTICRSSRAVLLALVAGLLGVPGLGAQDTTRAAADTAQAPAAPAGEGEAISMRSSIASVAPRASTTPRSIAFSSSLTLPGHS